MKALYLTPVVVLIWHLLSAATVSAGQYADYMDMMRKQGLCDCHISGQRNTIQDDMKYTKCEYDLNSLRQNCWSGRRQVASMLGPQFLDR